MPPRNVFLYFFMLTLSYNASAEGGPDDEGWFVGGMLGRASTEVRFDSDHDWLDGSGTYSESATGYGVYGGYNFTQWFGLELSVYRTEDVSRDLDFIEDAEFTSITVIPKFTRRLNNRFSIHGAIGLGLLMYEEEYNRLAHWELGEDETWGDVEEYFELGVQFDFVDDVKLRLGYNTMSGKLEQSDSILFDFLDADVDVKLNNFVVELHYQF